MSEKKNLTPYQGDKRTYGEFLCPGCGKTWSSGNAWANTGQMCSDCDKLVYPHQQRPLRQNFEPKDLGPDKVHPQDLCGKCRKMGCDCRAFERDPERKKGRPKRS